MAKKGKFQLNNIETELKTVAKSVTASLKRQGHPVPHSAVLHAVAAALNRRDWHKLKTQIQREDVESVRSTRPTTRTLRTWTKTPRAWYLLTEEDKYWAAIAGALGVRFQLVKTGWRWVTPGDARTDSALIPGCTLARGARHALETMGAVHASATLQFASKAARAATCRVTLNFEDHAKLSDFDAQWQSFAESAVYPVTAKLEVEVGSHTLTCTVMGVSPQKWYVPVGGVHELKSQLVAKTHFRNVLVFDEVEDAAEVSGATSDVSPDEPAPRPPMAAEVDDESVQAVLFSLSEVPVTSRALLPNYAVKAVNELLRTNLNARTVRVAERELVLSIVQAACNLTVADIYRYLMLDDVIAAYRRAGWRIRKMSPPRISVTIWEFAFVSPSS